MSARNDYRRPPRLDIFPRAHSQKDKVTRIIVHLGLLIRADYTVHTHLFSMDVETWAWACYLCVSKYIRVSMCGLQAPHRAVCCSVPAHRPAARRPGRPVWEGWILTKSKTSIGYRLPSLTHAGSHPAVPPGRFVSPQQRSAISTKSGCLPAHSQTSIRVAAVAVRTDAPVKLVRKI